MAVAENGRPVESAKTGTNGHAIGHVPAIRRRARPRKTWYTWALHNLARLTIWYTILTILFRCPSSTRALTPNSPPICESYLATRAYLQPHLQPYYDKYASSYVDRVTPYVSQMNSYVVRPATRLATTGYQKFAADHVDQVKEYGASQWNELVLPRVLVAQEKASSLYETNIGPHVSKALSIVNPYYETARDNAANVQERHVLPAIEFSKPHLQTAYTASEEFLRTTALPLTQHVWMKLVIFVDGTLWPSVKGLYGDNVRPQLVLINERIAKYQESRKIQAVIDDIDASEAVTAPVTTSYSIENTSTPTDVAETIKAFMSSILDDTSSVVEKVSSSIAPRATREVQHATDESISEDLVKWQKKFAAAADKGADDLRERVSAIVAGLVKSDIDNDGRRLAIALENTAVIEVENLKAAIKSVVASLPESASESEITEAEEQIMQAVRKSGSELRLRAKAIRDWSDKFHAEVNKRTSLAAETTLQILDSIRDLGLQEIGMRWAWMEGVTYQHWQKYHGLRQRFEDWRNEVQDIAVAHPAAVEAQELVDQILEEGMAVTETTAKELFQLKDVARWKIRARDVTDNFESRIVPAAAVSVASKIAAQVADVTSSLLGSTSTQGIVESLSSQASESISEASALASSVVGAAARSVMPVVESHVSHASSAILESSTGAIESVTDQLKSSVASASSTYIGSSTGGIESLASVASSSLSSASVAYIGSSTGSIESAVSQASAIILGTSTGVVEAAVSSASSYANDGSASASSYAEDKFNSASSYVSEAYTSASSQVSELSDSISSVVSSATASASVSSASASSLAQSVNDYVDSAAEAVSTVSSKTSSSFFAMAQEAKGQAPILDDVFDDDTSSQFSSSVQRIVDGAGTQYEIVTRALSEALYGTSTGSIESMSSLAASQYSQALSAASVALYGSSTGAVESAASVVSARYSQAVAAASSVIFASAQPTSLTDSFRSIYEQATSRAAEYSSLAQSVVSAQISGTPHPIHEQMLQSISAAYVAAVDSASSRLNDAANGASAQYSSLSSAVVPTQDRLGWLSAAASSRLQGALAAASSQYQSAKIAVGAEPTPLTMQAQQSYYAAIGYAYAQYSELVASGSSLAYGTSTPVYQQIIDAAKSQYSVASSAASMSLSSIASVATSTKSPAQSVLEQASASYSSLMSEASATLFSASEQARIAILGTKKPAYESALSSISSEYAMVTNVASSTLAALISSASAAVVGKPDSPAKKQELGLSSQFDAVLSAASSSFAAAGASISSLYYGPPAGSYESLSGAASENWEQLLSAASSRIYAQPTPVWASATSVAAQVTDAAAERFVIVQAYVSEILVGRDQSYTESVMSKLSSQYYDYGASVSSIASEVFASGSSVLSSVSSIASDSASEALASGASVVSSVSSVASSAVSAFFTTPPEVNSILDQVNSKLQDAIDAASEAAYGTSKGYVERASSAIADSYASASSIVSEGVYGTTKGYGEVASSSMADAASSASAAISAAIFGAPRPTGISASAVSAASAAQSSISSLLYGEQQGALESAWTSIQDAIAAANIKVAEFGTQASSVAASATSEISKTLEQAASIVSESVSSVTSRVKDEL